MRKIYFILLLTTGLLFASCSKNDEKTLTDQMNRTVKIKQNPEKVICLSPVMAEWLYKMNLQDKIIGRNSLCNYPSEIMQKTDVGLVYLLDTNIIKTLQPDLVISNSQLPKKWIKWFEDKDIDLILFKGGNKVADIFPAISLLGEIFNKQEDAKALISTYKKELDALEKTISDNKSRAYFAIKFFKGVGNGAEDITANKDHLYNDVMRLAGVENTEYNNSRMTIARADLVNENPDYILTYANDKEEFCSVPVYQKLAAVKEGRVIGIDKAMLQELSPRLIDAIKNIRQQISNEDKE